jgi:spore germination protein GerM
MSDTSSEGTPPSRPDDRQRTTPARRRPWPWLAIIASVVAIALATALAVVLVGDGDGDGDGDVATGEPPTAAPAPEPDNDGDQATDGDAVPAPDADTPAAETLELTVYFLDTDLDLVPVQRTVPATQAVGRAAMTELLRGPGASDPGGSASTIPAGTQLRGIDVADGIATVDLSGQFASGGGSASMRGRVAQIVYTLTEFDTVQAVQFLVEGERVEALGGEGILLAEPQTRGDWADL